MKEPRRFSAATWTRRSLVGLLLLGSVGGLAAVRPSLTAQYQELGKESDPYAVPNPEHLVVFSLGYRSALADLLFGKLMVEVGIHFVEKRLMENIGGYLWAIIRLDPNIRDLYYYSDTMLNLSTVEMPPENLRIARDILERGMQQFPLDAELALSAGMFIAYWAPQRLPESEDLSEWRAAGAEAIAHGCDVWSEKAPRPPVCVSGARTLSRAGKKEAAIAQLRRMLTIADDPKTREQVGALLAQLTSEREAQTAQLTAERMSMFHLRDLPSASRDEYQVIGPPTSPRNCVGRKAPWDRPACASSFATRSWTETNPD